jgi:hypothetical protein
VIKTELEHRNFISAAHLAASLKLADKVLKPIQFKALWQMAAPNRNAHGIKAIAQKYGCSK